MPRLGRTSVSCINEKDCSTGFLYNRDPVSRDFCNG